MVCLLSRAKPVFGLIFINWNIGNNFKRFFLLKYINSLYKNIDLKISSEKWQAFRLDWQYNIYWYQVKANTTATI